MSDFAWLIYIAEVLPNFRGYLILFGISIGILSIVLLGCRLDPAVGINSLRPSITAIIIAPIILLISVFIPSTKTVYLMAGAEVATDVVQTPEIQKVRTILNKKLDEYLKEVEEPEPEPEEEE